MSVKAKPRYVVLQFVGLAKDVLGIDVLDVPENIGQLLCTVSESAAKENECRLSQK